MSYYTKDTVRMPRHFQKKEKKMRKRLASIIGIITLAVSLFTPQTCVKADEYWPEGPDIQTPSAVVMEVNTGTVLYEKNSHEKLYPASITKILTTWLTLENCDLSETITFSEDAVYNNEGDTSHIWRDVNEQMTVEQTLYAVMLASANECAYAAAEHVGQKNGGDYRTFIDMMNERAKELGCTDSHFNNCNGLPDEKHVTSAYDMGLISCAAYKNEQFKKITGTKTYTIKPTNKHSDPTYLSNHHNLLHYFNTSKYVNPYCTGGKTGFTKLANSTLVTYAEKDGMTICVVVMNTNSPNHWLDTNKLIDYAFSSFKTYNISENEEVLKEDINKNNGILNNYKSFVTLDEDAYIVLPNTVDFDEAEFERDEDTKDKSVAKLKYRYNGHDVGSVAIVPSGEKVDIDYFDKDANQIKDSNVIKIKLLYVILVIVGIIILVVIVYYLKKLYENFYLIRHNMKMKRIQRDRFKEKKDKPKRRRRKDIMFK